MGGATYVLRKYNLGCGWSLTEDRLDSTAEVVGRLPRPAAFLQLDVAIHLLNVTDVVIAFVAGILEHWTFGRHHRDFGAPGLVPGGGVFDGEGVVDPIVRYAGKPLHHPDVAARTLPRGRIVEVAALDGCSSRRSRP